MFGCVVDTLGYRQNFTQVDDATCTLEIPNLHLINYISLFVFESQNLSDTAAQVFVEQGDFKEPLGYLSDFNPSFTVVAPKPPGKVNEDETAQIIIVACETEDVLIRHQHFLSPLESQMVDFQSEALLKHFHEYMEKYCMNAEGKVYLPLSQIQAWSERYQRYLELTK